MRLTKTVSLTAIALLVAVPALASAANPAALLSLQDTSSSEGTSADGAKAHKSHTTTFVLAGIGLAGVIAGAVALGTNDDNGTPASA
jgi:hypothetical protein